MRLIKFLNNHLGLVATALILYAVYLAGFVLWLRPAGWAWLWLLLPLLIFELTLRSLFFLAFGRHYKFALFNYFLVDHPVYGFAFRANTQSQAVPFSIYDQIVFRAGAGQIVDLAENQKQRVSFNINSLGFRGPEFTPKKKDPETIRIFASGGSTTACVYMNEEEAWPAILEHELRSRGRNVEVINAGVGGWYADQERLRFETEIVGYEPDIVLLNQGWNEEFVYSMNNLGQSWRPGLLMNAVELNSMYSRVGRLFSTTASIFFHLLITSYFRDIRFRRTMGSTNPARWECLRSRAYLEHWFDNLMAMARLASQQGVKLYTINAPGLYDFADLPENRKLYVQQIGTSETFADYAAVSKKRIQRTLLACSPVITCFDLEQDLNLIRGPERLKLFVDEFHLSAAGNALLAKKLSEHLLADQNFAGRGSNVAYDEKQARQIRSQIGQNYVYIDEFIDRTCERLAHGSVKNGTILELPMQRYTTF